MNRLAEQAIASLTMFTKIPFWRIFPNLSSESYRNVVTWWPFCGWITGLICGGIYVLLCQMLPPLPSAILAVGCRMMATGGYHEDGLADFFDGFGGGRDREKILSIMKDSHVGTYGVISLIVMFCLIVSLLSSLPVEGGVCMILGADPWGKFCSGRMLSFLEYARRNVSKYAVSYNRPGVMDTVLAFVLGVMPMVVMSVVFMELSYIFLFASLGAFAVSFLLMLYLKKKIGGYTGDCCGAVYIMTELVFCIIFVAMYI